MEPVRITTEEVQEAWRLFTVALDSLPADTPPDVVNRVVGLVLATRSRNDVAAMHNMIVVNLATFTEKIDALIVAVQQLTVETQRLVDIEELNTSAEWQALTKKYGIMDKGLQDLGLRKSNNK